MWKFSLLLGLIICCQLTPLPRYLALASITSQGFCKKHVHENLNNSAIVEAYLCGTDLPEGQTKEIFIRLSLYHLVVISASHLSFIVSTLQLFKIRKKWLLAPTLLGFGVLTGLQPPVVRALIQSFLNSCSIFFKLNWRSHWQLILGFFIALAIFPHWIESQSLLLSLGTGLALSFAKVFKSKWIAAFVTYLILLPLLAGWAQLHPAGIIYNLFLAPILAAALWFLSGLWLFTPSLANRGINILISILNELSTTTPFETGHTTLELKFKWVYLIILMTLLYYTSVKRERDL